MSFDIFEEQRRAARAKFRWIRFRNSIGDLSYLQNWIGFSAYALQFTCAIERGNPLSKIVVSHWASWERMIINA